MTPIKTRIEKAEKAKRAANPEEIRVWIFDPREGTHKRYGPGGLVLECLTGAEWEARTKNEKVITVRAQEEQITEYDDTDAE